MVKKKTKATKKDNTVLKYSLICGAIGAIVYFFIQVANNNPNNKPEQAIAGTLGGMTFGLLFGMVIGAIIGVVAKSKE